MAKYNHLPGVNLELLDGNLRVDNTSDARPVLVIGRAESGPSNVLYRVRDTNVAANHFGGQSPLIRKMSEALLGGATQIRLYRIGGKPARLNNIFGEGTYIATREQSVSASDKYRLYIGPRPAKDGKACLIVFRGQNIVYSNVPGSEIDSGDIEVVGFDFDTAITVGTPTEPVLFSSVIPTEKPRKSAFRGNGTTKEYALPNATKTDEVLKVVVKVNDEEKNQGSDYTIKNDKANNRHYVVFNEAVEQGHNISVQYSVKPTGNESGSAIFSGDGAKTKFDLAGTKATDNIELTKVTVANVDELATASVADSDDGLVKSVEIQTAPGSQKTILVEYIIQRTPSSVPGEFLDGEDNIDTTWKKYFELLHSALQDLEIINAYSIVTDAAILDAPNIADGSTSDDRLEYVYVYEEDGEIKYEWSDTKVVYRKGTESTKDPAEADVNGNGQPIVYRRYHEVNFGHLLATFAHSISENEDFALVTIGTSIPVSMSTYEISKWIGSPSTTDAQGNIISNGTGLLGLRNMVPRADNRFGFYKTSSGFVDGGITTDSNGAPIDIGKYLSVVPQVIVTPAYAAAGTVASITNAAGVYAGMLTTVQPGNSTTNTVIPRIGLPFEVKKTKLDQLTGAGYVMFKTAGDATRVVSGVIATHPDSDYQYVSTSIIISEVINRIRDVGIPFIGRGLTDATFAALDVAIESELQKLAEQNVIVKYRHAIIQRPVTNGRAVLDIALTILPPFELQEINVAIKLASEL